MEQAVHLEAQYWTATSRVPLQQISLSSTGLKVVPPFPSVQDAVNSTRDGRVSSLSSTGLQVVSPPAAVQGAGNSGTGGRAMAMSIPPVVTSPSRPMIDNPRGPVTEEMAIR